MPKSKTDRGGGRAPVERQPKRRRAGIGLEPLQYMLAVMRDPSANDKRRDAMAKEALPYRHSKLTGAGAGLKAVDDMTEPELEVVEGAKGRG
jgi:hypothetical protein